MPRSLLLFLVLVALFAFMAGIFGSNSGSDTKISFTQFMREVNNDRVRSVTIDNDGTIQGVYLTRSSSQESMGFKTQGLVGESLSRLQEKLLERDIDVTVKPLNSGWFVGLLSNLLSLFIIFAVFIFFMRRTVRGMSNGNGGPFSFGKSKAKLSQDPKKEVTFKDVAGVDEAKEELQEIIDFLREPQKFQKLGGRIPKGVLLVGPPGTGKTLLARAVAGEANVPFYSISGSNFVEMFVGVGASRVRDMFDQGKKNAPCIIFIDELDAVGRHRGAGLGGGHDEREQTLNQLLVEMDGFEAHEGVILVAATNRPDVLDPALLRPGRFDRRVIVQRPDIKGREAILSIHTQKIPLDDEINLNIIARGTPGFSGADLANLVNEAALNASRYNQKTIKQADFEFAKDKVIMGAERRSMIISDKEKMTTAVHEAGHALVTLVTPNADPLHKVTIIPRGMSLGSTSQLPEEDQHNHSKKYLIDMLAILMAGRVAEKIILDQETTGAQNDFDRAYELAEDMVCKWGMSDLGPMNIKSDNGNPFLGMKMANDSRNCSEETNREIDKAIHTLLRDARNTAEKTIESHNSELNKIIELLLANETISRQDIEKAIGIKQVSMQKE